MLTINNARWKLDIRRQQQKLILIMVCSGELKQLIPIFIDKYIGRIIFIILIIIIIPEWLAYIRYFIWLFFRPFVRPSKSISLQLLGQTGCNSIYKIFKISLQFPPLSIPTPFFQLCSGKIGFLVKFIFLPISPSVLFKFSWNFTSIMFIKSFTVCPWSFHVCKTMLREKALNVL